MTKAELYKELNYVNHSREKRLKYANLVIDNPELIELNTSSRIPKNLYQQKLDFSKYMGDFKIGEKSVSIIELNGNLVFKDYYMKLKLYPISPIRFFVEDIEKYLNFELDEKGFVRKLNYD